MDEASYESLLARLRVDLQLDPSVDCLPPGLVSAQGTPWKVDGGSGTVTFTASTSSAVTTVKHRLGFVPVYAAAFNNANNGVWFALSAKTATTVAFGGWFFTATTGTFGFDWVAIG